MKIEPGKERVPGSVPNLPGLAGAGFDPEEAAIAGHRDATKALGCTGDYIGGDRGLP